jgi:4-amino-4-deoxy-L-arabinose transferase-like glycosyltransferase
LQVSKEDWVVRTDYAISRARLSWIALTCLLATSFALFLQNLGTPDISTWDEVVHVNVVKNLAEHCCLPRLHRLALGTDYRDWGNNTLWLHKPLLPFYATAATYKLLGGSLWAFRLPGAIFALLAALVVYLIGSQFLNDNIGLFGAAIFSLNPFTNALVHGRTYSGFPDLFLAFFDLVALYLILDWTQTKSTRTLRWFGLVVGLGFLSKGGLALAPFAVLALVAILTGRTRDLIPGLQSLVVFGIVVLPERWYWRIYHPVESGYEQRQQFLHLFTNIEGHAEPWHFYFSHALPHILVPALVPLAYFSIGWALLRCRPGTPGHTLGIWSLAYLVPLSFAVSKIDNFIFAVFPVIALLIPLAVESLMHRRQFSLVISLCVGSFAAHILWQTALLSRTVEGMVIWSRWSKHPYQFTFLAAVAILSVALALRFLIKFDLKMATSTVLPLTSVALLLLYVHTNISENWIEPLQFNGLSSTAQLPLRQSGAGLRGLVDKNALIIVALDDERLETSLTGFSACGPGPEECVKRLAYLYIMYWSDVDVLDLCREPQPPKAVERYRGWENTYLITNSLLPAAPFARSAIGNVYSLSDIPFELWSPVATGACQQSRTARVPSGPWASAETAIRAICCDFSARQLLLGAEERKGYVFIKDGVQYQPAKTAGD